MPDGDVGRRGRGTSGGETAARRSDLSVAQECTQLAPVAVTVDATPPCAVHSSPVRISVANTAVRCG